MKRILLFILPSVLLLPAMALAEPRPIHEDMYAGSIYKRIYTGDLKLAVRGKQVQVNLPPPPPTTVPSPYAPEGLSDCDEMNWYREAVGLPDAFSRIGWRESNCRNEEIVRTFCCHGWWQMYTSYHLKDHRLGPRMEECGVRSYEDLNSNNPQDKLRQACAAFALWEIDGTYPWVATR
jgi:hypothetical protein